MGKHDQDPWMLDQEEHRKVKQENKGGTSGVICNKRNASINKPCHVCNEIQKLFASKDPAKKEIAYQKMAKANWYINIVTRDDPTQVKILEIGKKAGNDIIDGINDSGWRDIAHPLKDKGREMRITKKVEDGHNKYKVSPDLEKADWDVPKVALDNLPDLDNIIEYITNPDPKFPVKRISELKVDETFSFRICPAWKNSTGTNKRIITCVWRHWGGVTQEEVDGAIPVDLSLPDHTTQADTASLDTDTINTMQSAGKQTKKAKTPECFGKSDWLDENDDDCKGCSFFTGCKEKVNG